MSQEEFDYSVPANIERRLNELEEQKITQIEKLSVIYKETLHLRELQQKAKEMEKEADNTHNQDCTCMVCENK